jgi:hypothetical protein
VPNAERMATMALSGCGSIRQSKTMFGSCDSSSL